MDDDYQLQKMASKNSHRIHQFILKRIKQVQASIQKTTDQMSILELAVTEVSFAHLLNQYLDDRSHIFGALIRLSKAYIGTESYEEALIQARLAKKEVEGMGNGMKEQAVLLIGECLIRQNRFEDACEVFSDLKIDGINEEFQKSYYELYLTALVQLGQETKANEIQDKYKEFALQKYGQKSIQYGFFLIKRGRSFGKFQKYDFALENLRKGIDILIQRKCKDKKQITSIYLLIADYSRRANNLEKQYSSLICAQAMARQLDEPEKAVLPIVHALAANLTERKEYKEALNQLKKAKELEKKILGESSIQIGRTTKKIIQMLNILNMKAEARKCQQQYSRIIGSAGPSTIMKDKSNYDH